MSGAYLEDPMADSSRKNKDKKGRRKSDSCDVSPPPSLRRNKTAGDAIAPTRKPVRRSKSTDGLAPNREPRRTMRRMRSGESKRRSEKTNSKNLDPCDVLKMLERYADRDDGMAALMLSQLKGQEQEETVRRTTSMKIPDCVVVKQKSSMAA